MSEIKKQQATYENLKVYESMMKEYHDCPCDDFEAQLALANKAREYQEQFDWYCYSFEENGKVGMKDVFGRVVVPAQYDEILYFPTYECLTFIPVKAKKDGLFGILQLFYDRESQEVTAFEYEDTYPIEFTTYTAVRKPGSDKWGLIDFAGQMVVPAEMDDINPVCANGTIFLTKDGRVGVYDYVYEALAYPEYDEVEGMGEGGLLTFVKYGIEGHVDVNGKFYSFETLERFYAGENYDADGTLIFKGENEDDEPLFLADHLD